MAKYLIRVLGVEVIASPVLPERTFRVESATHALLVDTAPAIRPCRLATVFTAPREPTLLVPEPEFVPSARKVHTPSLVAPAALLAPQADIAHPDTVHNAPTARLVPIKTPLVPIHGIPPRLPLDAKAARPVRTRAALLLLDA